MEIDDCDEEVAAWLEQQLLLSIRKTSQQANNTTIDLAAKDSSGRIVGGLVAGTSYGWLLIKILWVEESHRGSGIGRSLIEKAELNALAGGCHGAWLDTSSQDAHDFYLNLGYKTFAELHNDLDQYPPAHQRWFMKKSLPNQDES